MMLNDQIVSFKLLSSRGGWKHLSFVPLDSEGNLTRWEFGAICESTEDGFSLHIPDSNGFLPEETCTLYFKEIH